MANEKLTRAERLYANYKARQEEKAQQGQQKDQNFLTLVEGPTVVRFLPHWSDPEEMPYVETFVHYPGSRNIRELLGELPDNIPMSENCPRQMYQKSCPYCDFRRRLFQKGSEMYVKLAKDLFPKRRYFANVVVISPEADPADVKVFPFGVTIRDEIEARYSGDEEMDVELFDVKVGHNVRITREGTGLTTRYKFVPSTRPSKLPDKEALSKLIDLSQYTKCSDKEALQAGVNAMKAALAGSNLTDDLKSDQAGNDPDDTMPF